MMSTKIYKAVHTLAEQLMDAANAENRAAFDQLYLELKTICTENETTDKDHPVQWETLADFTEELEDALVIYQQALEKAQAINSKDYMASISFSIANLKHELGDTNQAIDYLQVAKTNAQKIEDKAFKAEIDELLKSLQSILAG